MIQYLINKYKKRKLKSVFKEYGFKKREFTLEEAGKVYFAQWQHPNESPKEITQQKVDFIKQFAGEGDFVIDIGAHTGDTTVPMALATGKSGLTLALEPNPYVFKVLKENASLNTEKTNILPLNVAATENEGRFTFHYSDASFCNGGYLSKIKNQNHRHNYELEVEGINLNEILESQFPEELKSLKLIKIDAEGYDRFIISNITPILQKYRPFIITECLKKLNLEERTEMYEIIKNAGYRAYHLGNSREPEELSPQKLMKWKHYDILGIPKENPMNRLKVAGAEGQF